MEEVVDMTAISPVTTVVPPVTTEPEKKLTLKEKIKGLFRRKKKA